VVAAPDELTASRPKDPSRSFSCPVVPVDIRYELFLMFTFASKYDCWFTVMLPEIVADCAVNAPVFVTLNTPLPALIKSEVVPSPRILIFLAITAPAGVTENLARPFELLVTSAPAQNEYVPLQDSPA